MKLYIKNMVCQRCKMLVKEELKKLGLYCIKVDLGVAYISEKISEQQAATLKNNLRSWGLMVLEDKNSILVEKIKNLITEMIHYSDELPKTNYSNYISNKLGYNYTYLANIFSATKGVTIQRFIISHKIEKIKELLSYNELNLTEISYKLHYSSLGHLSSQFKKVTGFSPNFYKHKLKKRETNLENV